MRSVTHEGRAGQSTFASVFIAPSASDLAVTVAGSPAAFTYANGVVTLATPLVAGADVTISTTYVPVVSPPAIGGSLTLSPSTVRPGSPAGTLVGLLLGSASGAALAVVSGPATIDGTTGAVSINATAGAVDSTQTVRLSATRASPYLKIEQDFVITAAGAPILNTLVFSSTSFALGAAAGTVIGNITGKAAGSTLSVSPNDGRLAFSSDGSQLLVGLTASSAGTTSYTVTETLGGDTHNTTISVVVGAAPNSYIIGALTPAGMGDVVVPGATAIASGNSAGHFQFTGGAIVGSAAGVAAGYNAGPYAIVTDNGVTVNFTRVANAYSIGKASDFNNSSGNAGVGQLMYTTPGVLNGKRIIGRPGLTCAAGIDGGFASPLRNQNFGDAGTSWAGVTVESEDYSNPWTFTDTVNVTSRYISFKGLKVPLPQNSIANAAFVMDGTQFFPVTDVVIDSCQIFGAFRDVTANTWASDSTTWLNGKVLADNGDVHVSNIRIIGCDIRYPYRAVVIPSRNALDGVAGHLVPQPLHIAGNRFLGWYEQCLNISYTGADAPVTIEDNVFDSVVGLPSDDGGPPDGPHPDIAFSNATGATTDWTWYYYRNFHFHGNGRGLASTSLRDMPAGHYYTVISIGNVWVFGSGEGCLNIVDAKNCVALYNAFLSHETAGTGIFADVTFGNSTTSGTHRLTGNISEKYDGVRGTPTMSGNITLGQDEGTIPFSDVFVGARPTNRAAAIAALVTKGSYAAAGPFGTANPCNYPASNPSNILGSNNVS